MQHRDNNAPYEPNMWGFFGGHIEEGETPEQAVVREIKEELQIDIVPEYFGRYEHGGNWGQVERFVFIAYLTISLEQTRKQQTEGDDLGLFSVEEAKTEGLKPDRLQVLYDIEAKHLSKSKDR